jgi:hypothetical protein
VENYAKLVQHCIGLIFSVLDHIVYAYDLLDAFSHRHLDFTLE